ncbi:glycosyltransferase [Paraburkholderia fynbosensis]|uniref:Glycosyl transferase family 28 C-terminal domain-containing protein n=1 Tax=Paraburkholderia fynbosensis TaxID=1200993 RepID=A0A6J5GQE2_9BURK|nr:glycosyltransferase [Paraburkholderia fynbosensis]CAB3804574.1 hypothetical protein LMG27177_05679 [Paraburkholderia fynbosensis]
MKAVFYTTNDMGTGHARRTCALLMALRAQIVNLDAVVLTNSPFRELFDAVRVPTYYFPQLYTAPRSRTGTASARVSLNMHEDVALACLKSIAPELTVFDTYVSRRVASSVRKYSDYTCLVFRKCTPETFVRYVRAGYFAFFDLVVVPNTQADFAFALPSSALDEFQAQSTVLYVGPILFPEIGSAKSTVALKDRKMVLLLGGGGGYDALQRPFFERAACAVAEVSAQLKGSLSCCEVRGPLAQDTAQADIETLRSPVDVLALIEQAELVISHGGYNSVNEILAAGARAIFCPFYRRTESQAERVNALRGRSATLVVDSTIGPEDLAEAIASVIKEQKPERIPMPGADLAAAAILDLARTRLHASTKPRRPIHTERVSVHWDSACNLPDDVAGRPSTIMLELGLGAAAMLCERARIGVQALCDRGIPEQDIEIHFAEAQDYSCLPALVAFLASRRLRSVSGTLISASHCSEALFQAFERCRSFPVSFRYDII